MAEGDGLIKGGGHIQAGSNIRKSKIRRYQRRIDIRGVMRGYLESPDPVRGDALCRKTARGLYQKLKECPPFVGTNILRRLKTTTVMSEEILEHMMDEVWEKAEKHRILLIA